MKSWGATSSCPTRPVRRLAWLPCRVVHRWKWMASWFFPEPLRLALAGLALSSLLLAGCSGRSVDGIWINQAAIDAAVADDSLREALLAYGPNLEWRVQAARGLARFSNGFEQGEGRLQALAEGGWQVDFGLDEHEQLRRSGAELLQ